MKKYLFGIFAIVLAIGFSAFTTNFKSLPAQDATTTALYWYEVNGTDFGPLIEDQIYERSVVKASGAHPLTDCDADVTQPCIVGAATNDKEATALPSLTSDNTVFAE